MAEGAVAGEEVGAEEEAEVLAVEAGVTWGVAGEVDGAEAVPDWEMIAIVAFEGVCEQGWGADESGVDEMDSVVIPQRVE